MSELWEFEWKPHKDPEVYVREQLSNMRQRPGMYATTRGVFVNRVATLIEMAGAYGRLFVHLSNKQGCSVIKLGSVLDDEWAVATIDEALAILDGVKEQGRIKRPKFRYERP